MRLKTGWTPSRARSAATSASLGAGELRRAARRRSPCALSAAERAGVVRQAVRRGPRASDVDDRLRSARRNHGSICAGAVRSPRRVMPSRIAWAQREQPVRRRPAERGADGVLVVALAEARDLDLVEAGRARSPARAAPSAATSAKVRPIAITSPTDFIEVVSSGSAPGNFSKAKRGILVTT